MASNAASDGLYAHFYAESPATVTNLPALLRAGVRDGEAAVRAATTVGANRPPGTTLVAAAIRDDLLFVANVGDSRAYLACDRVAFQLTPAEAQRSSQRNLITRALGPAGPR